MGDKFKPRQERPKKNKLYQEDFFRGRKGKDRSNKEHRQNKNWLKDLYSPTNDKD